MRKHYQRNARLFSAGRRCQVNAPFRDDANQSAVLNVGVTTIELAIAIDLPSDTRTGVEHDTVARQLRTMAKLIERGAWSHAGNGYACIVNFPQSNL